MTLYSKLTVLLLSVCLCQCNYAISCNSSDEEDQGDGAKVVNTADKDETDSRLTCFERSYANWEEDIVRGRFAAHEYASNKELTEWMRNKEYEKVAAYLEEQIASDCETVDMLWKHEPSDDSANLGDRLAQKFLALSETLECGGNYQEACSLTDIFYIGRNGMSEYWRRVRWAFSKGNYEGAFKDLFYAVFDNYIFWNLDEALARHDSEQDFPEYSQEYMLTQIEYKNIYKLKDECIRVVCPDFHWQYDDVYGEASPERKEEIVRQYKQCFQEFMQFVEDEYSMLISRDDPDYCMMYGLDDPEYRALNPPPIEPFLYNEDYEKEYGPMVEQFRKLAKLP